MLLTLSQSNHVDLNSGSAHDFTSRLPHIRARLSPLAKAERSITALQPDNRAHRAVPESDMSTPHRGLPPASTILPEPNRLSHSLSTASPGQALGHMPAPPMQWQGQEDSMRNWLAAKAEEDKRKQEEEKTRQETLKLEQRRIEQSMLRESLSGGVPPHMVPMIYAGIGGAGMAQLSMDWLHHYASQLQMTQQQQQQQQHQIQPQSPEQAQRLIGQHPYQASTTGQQVSRTYSSEAVTQHPASVQSYPVYAGPTSNVSASAPRTIAQAQLPRLTTNDVFVHQPNNNPSSARPLQQAQIAAQDAPTSSPSIYFHHWVPPAESKNPSTPASKGRREDEPTSAHPGTHASDGEYKDSPRKRKAHGGHQPNPPPTTAPQYGSPSFSTTSSTSSKRVTDHRRNRSVASVKDDPRPESRKEEPHPLAIQQSTSTREDEERAESRIAGREGSSTAGAVDSRAEHKRGQSRGDLARTVVEDRASSSLDRVPS